MPTIPKVLTVDLDDTLWDVSAVIGRAERKLGEWLAQHYPRVVEHFDTAAITALRQQVVADHPERSHDFPFLRLRVLRLMLAGSGHDPAAAADAYAVFDGWRNTVTLFDDALPALERLAARFKLIALTNGSADVGRIGLGHVFSDSVTAVRAGAPKPQRAIFDYVVG
ncbi:MAG: HAD family hydrolase, partial [Pseudomonadota bacterium]